MMAILNPLKAHLSKFMVHRALSDKTLLSLGLLSPLTQVIILNNVIFFCLEIVFTFTNSVNPDEMQHYAAFHLVLHCLQKYSFRGFPNTKD